jgi:hypothetical protein
MHSTWLSYYWALCKKVGQQALDLWWKELLTATAISAVSYVWILLTDSDPNAWKNFRIILISTAITFGLFGIGHIVRAPWLIHNRNASAQQESGGHWGFGVLGAGVMIGIFAGAAYLTLYVWRVHNIPVSMAISAPPAPQIVQTRIPQQGPEPRDSLRRRTLKLADEYTEFFVKSQEAAPPIAIPSTPEPPPSEEQKKARQLYRDYWREIENRYGELFKQRFIGILKEYDNKGIKIGIWENDFTDRLPGISQPYTFMQIDDISRFRELAYHVDARDHLIVVTP